MANNALYMYSYVKTKNPHFSSPECRQLDTLVRDYLNRLDPKKLPSLVATDYLWNDTAPLKQYWFKYIEQHKIHDSMNAWHAVGPIFSEFGFTLIRQYPAAFLQHYLLPNIKEYFHPSLEVFKKYNIGQDSVQPIAKEWFQYSDRRVNTALKRQQAILLSPLPYIAGMANFLLLVSLTWLQVSPYRKKMERPLYYFGLFIGFFIAINFCFSVFASPVVFRYQYFPVVVCFGIGISIIGWLIQKGNNRSVQHFK